MQPNLRVCWKGDVEVADCIVGKTTVRACFLSEGQSTTWLLGGVSNLFGSYRAVQLIDYITRIWISEGVNII